MKIQLTKEIKAPYLRNLLAARGVTDFYEFINPSEKSLNDPKLLDNIAQGAKWLEETLNKENSHIIVVVDCDVDGFTSGAIIWNYIRTIAPCQRITYVLHEHKQHGLQDCWEQILNISDEIDLVILPDSSSNDYEYHELLGAQGIKCLILDHHEIDKDQLISSNACIINNQLSINYPNKDLTGAGVTWQFCRYHESLGTTTHKVAKSLIDLAALGICGDMGSVLSLENRYIMMEGFSNIKNYFFYRAIEKQDYSMGGKVNPMTVAFYIVPMINAMIRVGSMDEKSRLFQALIDGHAQVPCNKRGAKGTTEEVAIESLRECTNAKAKQGRITDQMVEKLEQKIFKYDLLSNKILLVRLDEDDDFPAEINGLIAMKLAAKYKHPTIVARLNNEGYNRGSGRGLNQSELADFKDFLNKSGFVEYAQGHANAFGVSIKDSDLRAFHEYANQELEQLRFDESVYTVDFVKGIYDTDLEEMIFELASHPELYGQNNPEPLIFIPNIYISPEDVQIMGSKQDTVKIEKNGISLLKFHATDMIEQINKCIEIKLNIVGKPNINEWMGRESAQIFIENYEVMDSLLEF